RPGTSIPRFSTTRRNQPPAMPPHRKLVAPRADFGPGFLLTDELGLTPLLFASAISRAEPEAAPAVATNALGVDLYRLEAASHAGNILLSPYSIETALTMAFGGAGGVTRQEMAKVMHLGNNPDNLPQQFASLQRTLEKAEADSKKKAAAVKEPEYKSDPVKLRVANRLFGKKDISFDKTFLSLAGAIWQAPLEPLDFALFPAESRSHINAWVEQRTGKRIQNLIPQGGVDKDTSLVLVNALFFKASWADQFLRELTKPLPFHVAGKTPVTVPLMYQMQVRNYIKGPDYAAITLPLSGEELQFLVILPNARDGLAALEKQLSAGLLSRLAKLPKEGQVEIHLPKFKLSLPALSLAKHLKTLGMKSAFDASADFTRMTSGNGSQPLFLSGVFHKTFIAIDEKGTEAGAATSAPVAASGPDLEFRADHPFLFAVQHRESGVCLFLGRLMDPR
ncbi:MAG TPA: serpin family protein, partial [Verrucomicrobiales bacterium]|nr:serpin family protein [Verrucomicrobiales bacterium]